MAQENKYTVISLFSGAGGLDIGLHQTGRFRLLAALDFDGNSIATLNANRKRLDDALIIRADLSTYDPKKLLEALKLEPGQVDLVVGGPPCKSFSTLGKRLGLKDMRGKLIFDYLRFIKILRPRMWLFENVDNILSFSIELKGHNPVSLIDHYARQAMKTGKYDVQGWLLNAANYGSPQSRERVLLIGNRLGSPVKTPKMGFGPPEAVAKGHYTPWRTLRDAIGDLKEKPSELVQYTNTDHRIFALVPEGGDWEDLPDSHPGRLIKGQSKVVPPAFWRRLKWEAPCPTVTTQIVGRSPGFCHPAEVRPLSVREAARVQGFPDDWVFCGGNGAQHTQIGNAVPIPLAAAAGQVIAEALDRAETKKPKKRTKWKGVFSLKWTKGGLLRSTLLGLSIPGGGNPLSEEEKKALAGLERQVRQHLTGYMKCGQALRQICDGKLYRETHETFEAYCNDAFGIDRSRAYQLLDAVTATENVDQWSTSEERPLNERQVRPLRLLAKGEDRAKAWDKAVEASRVAGSQRVSGRIVEEVVGQMLGRGAKPAPDPDGLDSYPFSLGGVKVTFADKLDDSPTSVKNAFTWAAQDMCNLLHRAKDDLNEDDRRLLLEEVRRNAEEVLTIVERTE